MRQIILVFLALCFVALAGATAYAYFIYIPDKVEQKIIGSFNSFGFDDLTFGSIEHKSGQIILSDIALDSSKFSTIDSMSIQFSLLKFLIDPHYAQDITIYGLKLTGELSDDMNVSISGWKNSKAVVDNLQRFPAGSIIFESASLDLLTDNFGGLNVKYNARISMNKSGDIKFKARAKSKQKKLEFNAKIEGEIAPSGDITFSADTDNISVSLQNLTIRRGTGKLNTQYSMNSEQPFLTISGDAQTASIHWHNLPLSNVHTTIEISPENYEINMNGSTFGPKKIKWQTKIKPNDQAILSETMITPDNFEDVFNFIKQNKKLSLKTEMPDTLLNLENPVITIKNSIYLPSHKTEGVLRLSLKEPALHIVADYRSNIKNGDILGTIKLDKTIIKSPRHDQDKTQFDVSAFGEFTINNYSKNPEADWFIHADILNGTLDFDTLAISGIRGSVFIGGNEKKHAKPIKSLPFSLPLKPTIKHNGKIGINLNDKDQPILDKIFLKIYDGEIKTEYPIFKNGMIKKKNTLMVSDINISDLIHDAGFENIFVTGNLGGIIPFETKDEGVHVSGAILQSQNIGILKLPEEIITGLFPGDSKKMQNIRSALKNYHYEYFEVRFDGDLSDRVMMTLNASGSNPDLKLKKPVVLKLQIQTQISLLFKKLMQ